MKMKWVEVCMLLGSIYGVSPECNVAEVRTILQGCKNLEGLTVVSRTGRTVVNNTNCGDLQSLKEFILEPYFRFTLADPQKLYTIILVDPDAPFMAEYNFFLHMVKANIRGSDLQSKDCCKNKGDNYNKFLFPTPIPGTGAHRYICLVYVNGYRYRVQRQDAALIRPNFNLTAFLRPKDLCGPVAATQFRLKTI